MRKERFIPAARFGFLTSFFDALCSFFGLGKRYRQKIIENISLDVGKAKVMDAGCGSGSLAVELKKKYQDIVLYAVDADQHILKIARKKSVQKKVEVHFRKAFLQDLPFPSESFDVVYSSLVFHHLKTEDKRKAMKEVFRVLKENGVFFLADFGKPKNIFTAVLSWFTVLFEEGKDNYQGKIPEMLTETGFEVKEVGRSKYNIVFWEGKEK